MDTQIIGDMEVSPTGKWLAYLISDIDPTSEPSETIRVKLIIASSNGQIYRSIPWKIGTEISRWVDDQNIAIKMGQGDIVPIVIFNPFTGEQIEFSVNYPDIYTLGSIPNWWKSSITVYDSTLKRVVFPRLTNDGIDMVLFDLDSRVILNRIAPVALPYAVPEWANDGSAFYYANASEFYPKPQDYELYRVTRAGEMEKLTNLNSFYKHTLITEYGISPDGNYIAFNLQAEQNRESISSWAVLDVRLQQVINICMSPFPFRGWGRAPIWSFDSKQFVIEVGNEQAGNHWQVILVDLTQGSAMIIAEDMHPEGIMIEP
jgi:Tol biopolymer transport system component